MKNSGNHSGEGRSAAPVPLGVPLRAAPVPLKRNERHRCSPHQCWLSGRGAARAADSHFLMHAGK